MSICSDCGENEDICKSYWDRSIRPPSRWQTAACRRIAELKRITLDNNNLSKISILQNDHKFNLATQYDCSPNLIAKLYKELISNIVAKVLQSEPKEPKEKKT